MMSHANISRHLDAMRERLSFSPESVSVAWLPHFHDYGLVQGILLPLAAGAPGYLMSPFSFLKRPSAWLEAISRYRCTHTFAFNFAYRFAAKRIGQTQKQGLDLSCLKIAGNGGEPVHPETTAEFLRAFDSCGLQPAAMAPAYGLAEATLMVSSNADEPHPVTSFQAVAMANGRVVPAVEGEPVLSITGCGPVLPGVTVAIVNPETRRRSQLDEIGEIWVSAPGVAQGYWQLPAESEEVFRARIPDEAGAETNAYLRTGDLGFLHGGHLYVSGRHKDLIIIRGVNYYPQDVEWTAQTAHPALRADNGAAFSIAEAGEERLCLVQEIERGQYSAEELDAVGAAIAKAVSEAHGVTLHAVSLIGRASIPKTTSGKIQRRACRQAFLDGTLKEVHRWMASGPAVVRPVSGNGTSGTPVDASGDADRLIEWLRQYAERRINSRLIDERRCLPPNIVLDFGAKGIFGLQSPKRYGGLELGHWDTLRFYTQLAAADPAIATLVFLHNTNGTRPVLHFATAAVRDELMPLLATGRSLAAFALSEPGAG
jgi:acyl-CoA synthetase (AMP-forming)/AMP-acid ligase II